MTIVQGYLLIILSMLPAGVILVKNWLLKATVVIEPPMGTGSAPDTVFEEAHGSGQTSQQHDQLESLMPFVGIHRQGQKLKSGEKKSRLAPQINRVITTYIFYILDSVGFLLISHEKKNKTNLFRYVTNSLMDKSPPSKLFPRLKI